MQQACHGLRTTLRFCCTREGFGVDIGQDNTFTPNHRLWISPRRIALGISSNWIYTDTGLADGDQIPGMVGYEMDGIWSIFPTPNAIGGTYLLLSASPYTDVSGEQKKAIALIYQAPSGAWVFGAGTTSWAWGLDVDGVADPRIQCITANILDRFVGNTN
jgi:hypothetical protein